MNNTFGFIPLNDSPLRNVNRRRAAGGLAAALGLALAGCGGGGSSSPSIDTLHDAYVALASGMTKAQVIALVPVDPSQGARTSQVLWVKGEEALGVRFNGSSDTSTIVFAQWGLSIPAGGKTESRRF
ncbi:MAG: hypothetical protein R3E42_11105 [Burkholderiaceae bacterium]